MWTTPGDLSDYKRTKARDQQSIKGSLHREFLGTWRMSKSRRFNGTVSERSGDVAVQFGRSLHV